MFIIYTLSCEINCFYLNKKKNQIDLFNEYALARNEMIYHLSKLRRRIKRSNLNFRDRRSSRIRSENGGGGIKSCYCKLKNSYSLITNDEEKLDFVCNCKRENQSLLLFKQHKSSLESDNYLPISSIRTSSRSKLNRSRNRSRELNRKYANLIENERRHKRRRNRNRLSSNTISTINKELELSKDIMNETSNEISNEEESNELKIVNDLMCTCNLNGCTGNCDHLSGCVCNDKFNCWGNSCLSNLNTLNANAQSNAQIPNRHPSELINLIYLTNNSRRLKKLKTNGETYSPSESRIINLDYPLPPPPLPFYQSIPIPIHNHQAINLPSSFIQSLTSSPLTFKTIILNEMENSNQEHSGKCNCFKNGRCKGLECNNLSGCICDEMNCYGKYCNLFKNYYTNQQNKNNKIKQVDHPIDYEFRQFLPKFRHLNHEEKQQEESINDKSFPHQEYPPKELPPKESSKIVKCEKIINNEPIAVTSTTIKPIANKIQLIKTQLNASNNEEDKEKLNAYEMKVVKLEPLSDSQLIDKNNNLITIENRVGS